MAKPGRNGSRKLGEIQRKKTEKSQEWVPSNSLVAPSKYNVSKYLSLKGLVRIKVINLLALGCIKEQFVRYWTPPLDQPVIKENPTVSEMTPSWLEKTRK